TALVLLVLGPLGVAASGDPHETAAGGAATPATVALAAVCGTHLLLPGRYLLTADVGPCPGDGIVIDGPAINLDLGGHTVTGGATGLGGGLVLAPTAVGSRVANGMVERFGTGVEDHASASVVTGIRAFSNLGIGIFVDGARGVRVSGSWANENGRFGYYLQAADRTLLAHDQAEFNGIYGLWLQGSSHNVVRASGFTDNATATPDGGGIYLGCSNHGVDPSATCAGTGSDGNRVAGNTASENRGFGIAIDLGNRGNRVVANTARVNRGTDLVDANPGCGTNHWVHNSFGSRSQPCIQ
ncbi:MAG TPA: right-handed parallel beta-helix repeat-containing protein, partial [Thermomicrobiaceae bacterium]|nr:right-handed parallel beta-helix repeat-containing protein [Thermomicrobiaceae bacterium]